jgi:hypothetical protein
MDTQSSKESARPFTREAGAHEAADGEGLADATVVGYKPLIASLELPDPNDRHVLAAAIRCGAGVIVTLNLADFPAHTLANFRIEAQHPDDFVLALLETFPDLVLEAARTHRASLRNPPKTQEESWGVETPNRVNRALSAMDSLAFAVGEPETYVQAPKAKGFRNRTLFGFPTPRSRVYRAVCGGAPQTFLP